MKRVSCKSVMILLSILCLCPTIGSSPAHADAALRGWEKKGGYQYVQMGVYPYEEDGTERPVLWDVLNVENGQALLLTDLVIDAHQAVECDDEKAIENKEFRHIASYAESDLVPYMNGPMLDRMFHQGSDPMQRALVEGEYGRLYCLQSPQYRIPEYGFSKAYTQKTPTRVCSATPYVFTIRQYSWANKVEHQAGLKGVTYWAAEVKAARYWMQIVGGDGHMSFAGYSRTNVGIRAACTIDLSLCEISAGSGTKTDPYVLVYAGSDLATPAPTAEPTVIPTAVPTPVPTIEPLLSTDVPAPAATDTVTVAPTAVVTAAPTALVTVAPAVQQAPVSAGGFAAPMVSFSLDASVPTPGLSLTPSTVTPPAATESIPVTSAPAPTFAVPLTLNTPSVDPIEGAPASSATTDIPAVPVLPEVSELPLELEEAAAASPAPATPAPTEVPLTGNAVFSFIGDCSIGDATQSRSRATSLTNVIAQNGFDYPFFNVQDIFRADDGTFANLEVCFTTRANLKSTRVFNLLAPPEYAQTLVEGSVEVVNTINNHAHDFKNAGYQDTLNALDAVGVEHFGSYRPGQSGGSDILGHWEAKGVRVGLVGFSYPSNSDIDRIRNRVQQLRDEGCNFIVVSLHWGRELHDTPNNGQYSFAKKMIEAGADMVWGHHPHVTQPIYFYQGKPIFFSTGNFIFGTMGKCDKNSDIFQVKVEPLDDGTTRIRTIRVIPLQTTTSPEYRPFLMTDPEDITKNLQRLVGKKRLYECDPLPASFVESGIITIHDDGTISCP